MFDTDERLCCHLLQPPHGVYSTSIVRCEMNYTRLQFIHKRWRLGAVELQSCFIKHRRRRRYIPCCVVRLH